MPTMGADRIGFGTPRGRWVLAATSLGSGMAFLDGTVVNVALPSMGRSLQADVGGLQWIINGYMLMLASLILLSGSLGDRLGRRRIFLIGTVWFAAASAVCAAAPSLEILIIGRILQGIGGALLTPGSLAILQTSFRPEDRSRAIGAWSGLTSVAAAVGPFVGGWLVDAGSWRLIFLINVPIAVVVIVMAQRHVPESRDESAAGRLDWVGATLATMALGAVTYALITAGTRGLLSAPVITTAVIGIGCGVTFVLVERASASPMLPPAIFANRRFTGANLVTVAVYGGLGTVTFLVVVYLQEVLNYSALASGAALLPMTLLMLGFSSRAGQLAGRIGPRLPMTIGPVLMAAGFLLMVRIGPESTYIAYVLPAVIVVGLGLVTTVAPLTATVLAAVEDSHAGVASGVNNAVARSAQLMAVAAIPLAAGITGDVYRDPSAFGTGFRTAMLISAGLALIGGLVAAATIGGQSSVEEQPGTEDSIHSADHYRHCAVESPPLANCPGTRAPEHESR